MLLSRRRGAELQRPETPALARIAEPTFLQACAPAPAPAPAKPLQLAPLPPRPESRARPGSALSRAARAATEQQPQRPQPPQKGPGASVELLAVAWQSGALTADEVYAALWRRSASWPSLPAAERVATCALASSLPPLRPWLAVRRLALETAFAMSQSAEHDEALRLVLPALLVAAASAPLPLEHEAERETKHQEGDAELAAELRTHLSLALATAKNASGGEWPHEAHAQPAQCVAALCALLRGSHPLWTHVLRDETTRRRAAEEALAALRNIAAGTSEPAKLFDSDAVAAVGEALCCSGASIAALSSGLSLLGKLTRRAAGRALVAADQAIVAALVATATHSRSPLTLADRALFVLGNVTAEHEAPRLALSAALQRAKWGPLHALADAMSQRDGEMAEVARRVEVGALRLMANMSTSRAAGEVLANAPEVRALVPLLRGLRGDESEELALNALSALTNITFYRGAVLDAHAGELSVTAARFLFHANAEVVAEALRALGNLTQTPEARRALCECRADEAVTLLLAHSERLVVHGCCGVLINLAGDASRLATFERPGSMTAVVDALQRWADEVELAQCLEMLLLNLALHRPLDRWLALATTAAVTTDLKVVASRPL